MLNQRLSISTNENELNIQFAIGCLFDGKVMVENLGYKLKRSH